MAKVTKLTELNKYKNLRGLSPSAANIWAIAGGKGGVGKSFISSGLSLFLAKQGFTTVIIDLDFDSPNIHTYLGLPAPEKKIKSITDNNTYDLESIMIDTHLPNLKFISCYSDDVTQTPLSINEKSKLMSAIHNLNVDYIILDLNAGIQDATIDFFNLAQKHIVVTTPDPLSIESTYRFMKTSFHRHLLRVESQFQLNRHSSEFMKNPEQYNISTPADLLYTLNEYDSKNAAPLLNLMSEYGFQIILNQARSMKDEVVGQSMQLVCNKYFGVPSEFIARLDYDNGIWQSIRRRKHLLMENSHSKLYSQLLTATRSLIDSNLPHKMAC